MTLTNSLRLNSWGFHWKTLVPGPLCNVNTDLTQHYRLLTGRKIIRTVWSRSLANVKPKDVVRMSTGNNMSYRKTDKIQSKTVVPGKGSLQMVLQNLSEIGFDLKFLTMCGSVTLGSWGTGLCKLHLIVMWKEESEPGSLWNIWKCLCYASLFNMKSRHDLITTNL